MDLTTPLPPKRDYGPFVRLVTPGLHLFRTQMYFSRWLILLVGLGGVALFAWVGWSDWSSEGPSFMAIFMWTMGAATLPFVVVMATLTTRLEVTPASIRLRKKWWFRWSFDRTWSVDELRGAGLGEFMTFHVGGSTALHTVKLAFSDGEIVSMGSSFDSLRSARAFAQDINASVQRAIEAPASF
jgi:hypothetical protein